MGDGTELKSQRRDQFYESDKNLLLLVNTLYVEAEGKVELTPAVVFDFFKRTKEGLEGHLDRVSFKTETEVKDSLDYWVENKYLEREKGVYQPTGIAIMNLVMSPHDAIPQFYRDVASKVVVEWRNYWTEKKVISIE